MIFKYLIILLIGVCIIESSNLNNDNSKDVMPDGDTTGVCSFQLNAQPHKRNCRYGKCEIVKNSTDYACHCDQFITGKKCDRPVKDSNDACSSNPCWGESECVLPDSNNTKIFKCICSDGRTGKFCHLKSNKTTSVNTTTTSTTIITNMTNLTITTTTRGIIPVTTTKNFTNIEKSTISLKLLNDTKIGLHTTLATVIKNLLVPDSENLMTFCNYETCQLGKCLRNGTCECSPPAFGKYCDRIDECLIMKCINGNCTSGKGCICIKGYTGAQCETPVQNPTSLSPSTSLFVKNNSVTRRILITKRPIKSNSTRLHKTRVKISTKPSESVTSLTTPLLINNCENGGLLIDNSCLCLNQYTGPRCEITPEQVILNENETIAYLATKQQASQAKVKSASNSELAKASDKLMNKEDENTSVILKSEDQNKWSWLECFPGDSFVYVKNDNSNSYKVKKMSELNIDDMVLTNENLFSKVVTFLHRIEKIDAKYFRLHFNNDQSYITLTPKHLIFVKSHNKDKFEYIPANQVKLGDELTHFDSKLKRNNLVKVDRIEILNLNSSGIYAPLTESGTLIVDNIYVSCYSLVKSHQTAQFFFNILFTIKKFVWISSDACLDYAKYLFDFVEYFKLTDIFLNLKS